VTQTSFEWTDRIVAELCRLWDLGETATSAAEKLSTQFDAAITRNAVIGKIHRLRKAGHEFKREKQNLTPIAEGARATRVLQRVAQQRSERQIKEDLAIIARARQAAARAERESRRPAKVAAKPAVPAAIIDATFAKPWMARLFGECAFPIAGEGADTVSCCAQVRKGSSYCRAHHQLMFVKPTKTGNQFVKSTARIAA
jgi:GcrA cell cycle regulator